MPFQRRSAPFDVLVGLQARAADVIRGSMRGHEIVKKTGPGSDVWLVRNAVAPEGEGRRNAASDPPGGT